MAIGEPGSGNWPDNWGFPPQGGPFAFPIEGPLFPEGERVARHHRRWPFFGPRHDGTYSADVDSSTLGAGEPGSDDDPERTREDIPAVPGGVTDGGNVSWDPEAGVPVFAGVAGEAPAQHEGPEDPDRKGKERRGLKRAVIIGFTAVALAVTASVSTALAVHGSPAKKDGRPTAASTPRAGKTTKPTTSPSAAPSVTPSVTPTSIPYSGPVDLTYPNIYSTHGNNAVLIGDELGNGYDMAVGSSSTVTPSAEGVFVQTRGANGSQTVEAKVWYLGPNGRYVGLIGSYSCRRGAETEDIRYRQGPAQPFTVVRKSVSSADCTANQSELNPLAFTMGELDAESLDGSQPPAVFAGMQSFNS